jgi:hypothetical protein
MKLMDQVTKDANVALAVAQASETAAPRLATVVAKGVPKTGETADVLKKANDTRMKALAVVKGDASTGAVAELSKLDSSKAAIRYFVETATHAAKAFDAVADVVDVEFRSRVRNPDTPQKGTILDKIKPILVTHNFLTPAELDQLEATYIWEMISNYCKNNVVFVKEIGWGAAEGRKLRGLNNVQVDALGDLFGASVTRGKYFFKPWLPNPYLYLAIMPIKEIVEDTGRFPPR